MRATHEMQLIGILEFQREQENHRFQRIESLIDVIPQEQVIEFLDVAAFFVDGVPEIAKDPQ